ncbi:MAG: nuclear transport factor 2 family protein [Pseudomonas sp.]|jgi:SnoaL-like protein|uniref:nuclear transport factor 2 family protein n=1 Tax=Pseudomonas TaxID=286 RepID=UPI000281C955|nr:MULTISPECIES: nuclear transport factor 2 family protein [Pseudomonas]MDP9062933.1 nuclear transport factor 2 family protein [Pseudomonadota bacterium]MDE1913837.1 nuclear transport factor 2 family protein [Pseudomonas sp.]MDE2032444.1 nuclear transport factor 2 family protein [Pseudomonas sp.]MDE2194332.1 nuclear transport factor 2 family protein [Pseudomonas sp.]MDE2554842.1 nuclear transport factor 2 family protein [Pseudomonas sp.]
MDLLQRVETLEGESQVRRLMARYMDLCDVPRAATNVRELAELFTVDAVWEGIGTSTAQTFGQHRGRDAVAAFVGSYLPPSEHFALNLHYLTSESIQVDGSAAAGQWIMQQISTYADQRSELFGTRLAIDFRRVDGTWLIAHFRTQRLFNSMLGVNP